MSRLVRTALLFGLGSVGMLASASPAAAQFVGGFGRPPLRPVMAGRPGGILPFQFNYYSHWQFSVGTPLGPSLSVSQTFYGPAGYWMQTRWQQSAYSPYTTALYTPSYSSYMTGGGVGNPVLNAGNPNLARAQKAAAAELAAQPVTRDLISELWSYEKQGAPGGKAAGGSPNGLGGVIDESSIASGASLNRALAAAAAAEKKGGKAESSYLPPELLGEIRFSGSSTADAINLLRRAGRLDFPAVFSAAPLADVRPALERDFAAVAAPVLVGKAADPARLTQFEATVQKARKQLDPRIQDLDFEDATAARRFLNQMDSVAKALKGPGATGLVDPRWSSEGTNVADLVKLMTKNKVQFGPVRKGSEDAYISLYRGLVAYLANLTDSPTKPAVRK